MVHSLTPSSAPATITSISTLSNKNAAHHLPSLSFQRICASHSDQPRDYNRRTTALGLAAGLVVGLNAIVGGDRSARAAGRRPPPPPPEEKKDPGINAVTAKVLASKKRKEAMKEAIAKLRERGKIITEPPK